MGCMPDAQIDERTKREHEEQKTKHLKDHRGDEMRQAKTQEEKAANKLDHVLKEEIGYDEKGERRERHETDAALAETANTILGNEQ